MKILTGKQAKPRRILLYGPHGVGKSSWAAGAPKPIFLNIEDGLNDIDCAKTEKVTTYEDLVSAIAFIAQHGDEFKTVVLDTLDWTEALVFKRVAQDANKSTVEEIGYGKGYKLAPDKWRFLLSGFEVLQSKGKTIILLAHAKIETFESPETERYDRYEPDLHELGSSLIQEWCDEVLFASFKVFTKQEDLGFNKTRQIALGGKDRIIRTNESAAALAKNRLRLPDELPLAWSAYAKHLPEAVAVAQPSSQAANGNIAGVVVEGSSKKKEVAVA